MNFFNCLERKPIFSFTVFYIFLIDTFRLNEFVIGVWVNEFFIEDFLSLRPIDLLTEHTEVGVDLLIICTAVNPTISV